MRKRLFNRIKAGGKGGARKALDGHIKMVEAE